MGLVEIGLVRVGQFFAARFEIGFAALVDVFPHRFNQQRQCRFAIAGDRHIDIGETLEILIVRFRIEIAATQADEPRARLSDWLRRAVKLVAIGIDDTPIVVHLQAKHHLGLRQVPPRAGALVQRMPGG